ncbi:MAG: hypothetical protein EOQ92_31415, partial [Mesorhizobium sp.]
RYSAVEGALASGFAIADLHHAVGHDRCPPGQPIRALVGSPGQLAVHRWYPAGRHVMLWRQPTAVPGDCQGIELGNAFGR